MIMAEKSAPRATPERTIDSGLKPLNLARKIIVKVDMSDPEKAQAVTKYGLLIIIFVPREPCPNSTIPTQAPNAAP
jgi:hypothetical protein